MMRNFVRKKLEVFLKFILLFVRFGFIKKTTIIQKKIENLVQSKNELNLKLVRARKHRAPPRNSDKRL